MTAADSLLTDCQSFYYQCTNRAINMKLATSISRHTTTTVVVLRVLRVLRVLVRVLSPLPRSAVQYWTAAVRWMLP